MQQGRSGAPLQTTPPCNPSHNIAENEPSKPGRLTVFLDADGVVNSLADEAAHGAGHIRPELVDNLVAALLEAGAAIDVVIMSTWRTKPERSAKLTDWIRDRVPENHNLFFIGSTSANYTDAARKALEERNTVHVNLNDYHAFCLLCERLAAGRGGDVKLPGSHSDNPPLFSRENWKEFGLQAGASYVNGDPGKWRAREVLAFMEEKQIDPCGFVLVDDDPEGELAPFTRDVSAFLRNRVGVGANLDNLDNLVHVKPNDGFSKEDGHKLGRLLKEKSAALGCAVKSAIRE